MTIKREEISQGDTLILGISSLKDEYGAAVTSLAGWSFKLCIKNQLTDADSSAVVTVESSGFAIGTTDASVTVQPSALSGLTVGRDYYLAVKMKTPGGAVKSDDRVLCIKPSALKTF